MSERASLRSRIAMAVVSSILTLAATGASAERLTQTQKERICAAIDILKTYDACCKTENPEGFSPGITVSACLEKIKKASETR